MLLSMITMAAFVTLIASLTRTEIESSSTLSIKRNHILAGHAISSQRAYDLLACAHRCLANPRCMSFNFEDTIDGLCELNSQSAESTDVKEELLAKHGFVFGQLMNISDPVFPEIQQNSISVTFTTLGAIGSNGPTTTAGYAGTALEGTVILSGGIQYWTVPRTGDYVIKAFGSSGGNGTYYNNSRWNEGGLGAMIEGTFHLKNGTLLKILVGQQGSIFPISQHKRPGSGGGGTFVTRSDDTPFVVAGGGGGGGISLPGYYPGDPGQAGENGSQYGGIQGRSGNIYQTDIGVVNLGDKVAASAGGGLLGDGGKAFSHIGVGGASFEKGGKGGSFLGGGVNGGFGGGGFGLYHPGGGGGYSGGGVAGYDYGGVAGGGGSYNSGANQVNKAGINKGDGRVIITTL